MNGNGGMLLVVSAPSGCGKSTIVNRVMQILPRLVFSVSHTTRLPRPGETDGVHYHFVDKATFAAIQDQQPTGFLEWAEVHGHKYGTSVDEINRHRQEGMDVILDIDVQGAAQVRQRANPVSVFIAPPSFAELERRLRSRKTENEATIRVRLANARKEMACADVYDYLVVNDRLEDAVESLKSIIIAERCRRRRLSDGQDADWGA